MPCYFAYGSNLSSRQMAERCPGAATVGPARLEGFALAFTRPSKRWGGHAADVIETPGSAVWGLAWQVTDEHMSSLDRFEGVAAGAYRRRAVRIARDDGSLLDAIAYTVVEPVEGGMPSGRYLEVILDGAREHGLPADWVTHLESFRT